MMTSTTMQKTMDQLYSLTETVGDPTMIALARFLNERIAKPESFVVMLGETSSGKTTIINGLLGSEWIKTGAAPTTGTIIEVMDDTQREQEVEFYAVNRDATLEELSYPMFQQLAARPDPELQRLRLVTRKLPRQLTNLRLFDTPGYGSIVEQHEELLKEFVPNSDILIYVVSYRVGFKENDHHFMQYISELINKDTEVVLVINRAPQGVASADKRVEEIKGYAEDCLHRKLSPFIVHSLVTEDGPRLPEAPALWDHVRRLLEADHRQANLLRVFKVYQRGLLLDLKQLAEKELIQAQVTESDITSLQEALDELFTVEQQINEMMETEFSKLDGTLGKWFEHAKKETAKRLETEIRATNKWVSKDECVGFVQAHLLPLHIKNETKMIAGHIQDTLERLDQQIQSMLNTAVTRFETQVEMKASIYTPLLINLSNRVAQKAAGAGLQAFFRQFGGAGGAGAGVANAAKVGLKKLGNVFGKTFSRETHNALAQLLKRIGATSTRAIASAAAVIVEGLFYLFDSLTWQNDLLKMTHKALEQWQQDTLKLVRQDLSELKALNDSNLEQYFTEYKEACRFEEPTESHRSYDPKEVIAQIDELLRQLQIEEESAHD